MANALLTTNAMDRRTFVTGLTAAASLLNSVTPGFATPEMVAVEIKRLLGDRKGIEGKIKLELPTIAENGLVVPLGFEVESPMTETD